MEQGTNRSPVPWMKRMGSFVWATASVAETSRRPKPPNSRVKTPVSASSGPETSHGQRQCSTLFMIAYADSSSQRIISRGEEKPQSAMMPRTEAGSASSDAISTVAAPIDSPSRISGCAGPKCMAAYCAQVTTSLRSRTPKVI